MIIVYGTRFYGKVSACGPSFVATRFFHIWYLPLIPVGTQLILEESSDGYRGLPLPFSFKSMFAGYLRVWGPIAVLASIVMSISIASELGDDHMSMIVGLAFAAIVTLALIAGTIVAYAVVGSLSHEDRRRRAIYAMQTGCFADPADMGEARQTMRQNLLATIAERARGLASMGYRMSVDPVQAWPHFALDPTHNDHALVAAAFTLARVESSLAQGPHQAQMNQLHDALWQRILKSGQPIPQV